MRDYKVALEKFFNECLRFWEREFEVDSDLSKKHTYML